MLISKDMLEDLKIGIYLEHILICSSCSSENPVVAITIGIEFALAKFSILMLASGIEKSIITSGNSLILLMSV